MMDLFLRDKKVLVTGSSRGIGKSIAEGFLREGAKVLLTGRSQGPLNETHESFCKRYGTANVFQYCGDLIVLSEMERCLEYVRKIFQGLDILVLNIGSGRSEPSLQFDIGEWQRMFQVNFFSSIHFFLKSITLLKKGNRPSVVFISSIAAVEDTEAPVSYSAAKGALTIAAQRYAKIVVEDNIRVNVVAPGNVKFPGGRWEEMEQENPEAIRELLKKKVPQQRFASPEEIADLVLFLASQRSSFITGTVTVIDGGQVRRYL